MKRIAELDGLRGIAAIAIVAFHYGNPSLLFDRVLYVAGFSLDLFFVLSGFLISSIILAHVGEKGFLRAFYIRRGLRIYPIYYLIVLAYIPLVALRPSMGDIRAAPFYLTFTQFIETYWFARPHTLTYALGPTWSLACEEQFYIAWPLLIGVLGRRWMTPAALACIVLAIVARRVGFSGLILITNCDGFAFGGLLAIALAGRGHAATRPRPLSAGFSLLAVACLGYFFLAVPLMGGRPFEPIGVAASAINKSVVGCFFACVVGLCVCHRGHPALAPLRARWLRYMGLISYGIYLYHMTAIVLAGVLCKKFNLPPESARLVVAPALCLAMAAASWAWIEKPLLGLKDKFNYGPTLVQTPIESPVGEVPAGAGAAPD